MHNKITRRKFIKWAAIVGGAIIVSSLFSFGGKALLDKRRRAKRLAGNAKELPVESNRWFTPRECALISALAALIVPTDEIGPGASNINVVDAIGHVVEKSQDRHILYRKGLDAFDEVAQREYDSVFAKLTCEQQMSILKSLDNATSLTKVTGGSNSLLDRVNRKAKKIYYKYKLNGFGETIDLFPVIVTDVMKCFYTSQVAWNWLGYDGPPMPNGYLGQLSKCEQY
ncbi:MAG: hypothetical protein A3H23_01415 [Planctomycetes bacterium RIFCSPLOWO2_12_FULL_40_19]|nr:MAG: hypothetical protein A3H23_01415 [Planctomycetes bacterium RIFCSPLOWO2_12_FULL_40_19]